MGKASQQKKVERNQLIESILKKFEEATGHPLDASMRNNLHNKETAELRSLSTNLEPLLPKYERRKIELKPKKNWRGYEGTQNLLAMLSR